MIKQAVKRNAYFAERLVILLEIAEIEGDIHLILLLNPQNKTSFIEDINLKIDVRIINLIDIAIIREIVVYVIIQAKDVIILEIVEVILQELPEERDIILLAGVEVNL